ncbi:MAG: lipid-A-disaccharide synthase-related protein [Synechococcus sp.]|nr:lipid-A-disaccharide synthase-related protein [Synechococcus sp.]
MPSHQPPPLLVLCNGHGEDVIALRLLEALHRRRPDQPLAVLPLVGGGEVFAAAEARGLLQRLGPRLHLPSGGFSNQSPVGLLRDLGAGLPGLSLQQLRLVRRWGRRGHPVLAVGDLLPLLLAWAGGGPYGFIGTPKSDFTWTTPPPHGWGSSPLADAYHRCKGSEWDPWEWALMGQRRCRLVALRDRLSARGLRRHGVRALAPGNPMMDGLRTAPLPEVLRQHRRLLLLPGSRMPEALHNLERLLAALPDRSAPPTAGDPAGIGAGGWDRSDAGAAVPPPITVLLTCGNRPTAAELAAPLRATGLRPVEPQDPTWRLAEAAGAQALWRRPGLDLWLGAGRFAAWAGWAELGLACAGTATEQLVGLGIAALSLPGAGPQFQVGFARRQSRLLGGAVQPCPSPAALRRALLALLADPDECRRRGRIGQRRMGPAGASDRLAALIDQRLLEAPAGSAPTGG